MHKQTFHNQKMWQLWCTATWGCPTLCQSFSALTEMIVPNLKSIDLSVTVQVL